MPLRGSRCLWLSEDGTEQQIDTAACLACAGRGDNPCGLPLPMLASALHTRERAVVAYSSTMLSGCARAEGLKLHRDYYVSPLAAYARAFGSLVHAGAEHLTPTGTLSPFVTIERRFRRTICVGTCSYDVTAQVDILHHGAGVLRDYKVVDSLAPSKLALKVASYVPQCSIQRWVLAGNDVDVARIELVFLKPGKAGMRVVNLYPDGDIDISTARLWTFSETEAYLAARLPELAASLDGNFTSPLDNREEWWRCYSCDVRAACRADWGRPLPVEENGLERGA